MFDRQKNDGIPNAQVKTKNQDGITNKDIRLSNVHLNEVDNFLNNPCPLTFNYSCKIPLYYKVGVLSVFPLVFWVERRIYKVRREELEVHSVLFLVFCVEARIFTVPVVKGMNWLVGFILTFLV